VLTTTDNWQSEIDRAGGIVPVYLVTWAYRIGGALTQKTTTFSTSPIPLLTDSGGDYLEAIPNLSDVASVSREINILDRSVSVGDYHLEFVDDGIVRGIIAGDTWFNSRITIKLGTSAMTSESDFLPVAVANVTEITPSPGKILLECTDISGILENRNLKDPRYWLNMHPFEIIRDIFLASGLSSSLLDETLLDYTSTSNPDYSAISHWVCSRLDVDYGAIQISKGVKEDTDVKGLIDDLSKLIWASLIPEEDGIFRLRVYDDTKAKVRHFTQDELSDLTQTSSADPLYTRATVNAVKFTREDYAGRHTRPTHWTIDEPDSEEVTVGFSITDEIAKQKYDFLSDSDGLHTLVVETNWLVGPSGMTGPRRDTGSGPQEDTPSNRSPGLLGLWGGMLLADHTDWIVNEPYTFMAMCGSKMTISVPSDVRRLLPHPYNFTINTESSLGGSRPAYLLIEGPAYVLTQDSAGAYHETSLAYQQEVVKIVDFSLRMLPYTLSAQDEDTIRTHDLTGTVTMNPLSPLVVTGVGTSFTSDFLDNGRIRITNPSGFDLYFDIDTVFTDTSLTLVAPGYTSAAGTGLAHGYPIPTSPIQVFYRSHYGPSPLVGNPNMSDVLGPFLPPNFSTPSGPNIPYWLSKDIAGTAATKNASLPTGLNPSGGWTVAEALSLNYPPSGRVTVEGTAGANGTYPFPLAPPDQYVNALGSPASGRGQFGTVNGFSTAAIAWWLQPNVFEDPAGYPEDTDDQQWYPRIWDVTLLVHAAQKRVARFSRGVPRFTVTVPLVNADLQIGDFISMEDDIPLFEGRNGLTSDVILEITSKEIDALGDSPGVHLGLAWVRDDGSSYSPTFDYAVRGPHRGVATGVSALVTDTTGLTITTTLGSPVFMRVARTGGGDN
jgi:hypothetical protein